MNKETSIKDDGKKKTWRKSENTNNTSKSIEVEEIQLMNDKGNLEPAFLVCYYKSDSSGEKYKSEERKICMKTNPLADQEEDDFSESEKIKNDYKGWFDAPMMEI